MKRGILASIAALVVLAVMSPAHAVNKEGEHFWRSSYTETADTQILISSEGILGFGGVYIGSATNSAIGTGSGHIIIFDDQIWAANMTTVTSIDCTFYPGAAVSGPTALSDATPFRPIQLSSGLFYTKTGGCKVNIFWDVLQRNSLVLPIRVK